MIKKISSFLLLIIGIQLLSYADWRNEILSFFGEKKDYKGAVEYLLNYHKQNDKAYNPAVCGLLAYVFRNLDDKNNEYKWLGEYFENYRGWEGIFNFLDYSTYLQISDYLSAWRRRYPLVTEMALIDSDAYKGPSPPGNFVITVDIENDAYYKLSDREKVLKGGLLKRGFNSINLSAKEHFEKSASYVFFLDLKTDDLLVRKEIEIEVQLESRHSERKSVQSSQKSRDSEYRLSMYVGDKLVVSSKKLPSICVRACVMRWSRALGTGAGHTALPGKESGQPFSIGKGPRLAHLAR